MTSTADASVLFPLLVQGHIAHDAAKAWWDTQADASVGTCLLTRLAILRLLTNRVAMNGTPVAPTVALSAWRQLASDPRSIYFDGEPAGHEDRFVSLVSSREPSPNLLSDAWLAAMALSLNCGITTFDRGFKWYRGLQLHLLTVPGSSRT